MYVYIVEWKRVFDSNLKSLTLPWKILVDRKGSIVKTINKILLINGQTVQKMVLAIIKYNSIIIF